MRKYSLGRFLSSLTVVFGLFVSFLFGAVAFADLMGSRPFGDALGLGSAFALAIAGVPVALSGLGFHALFDIASAVTKDGAA